MPMNNVIAFDNNTHGRLTRLDHTQSSPPPAHYTWKLGACRRLPAPAGLQHTLQ